MVRGRTWRLRSMAIGADATAARRHRPGARVAALGNLRRARGRTGSDEARDPEGGEASVAWWGRRRGGVRWACGWWWADAWARWRRPRRRRAPGGRRPRCRAAPEWACRAAR